MEELSHQSVLLKQAVDALIVDANGFYIDGTFGRGGHAREILGRLSESGSVLVIDKDSEAIHEAEELKKQDKRVHVLQGSFIEMEQWLGSHDLYGGVSGVLLDLGVSSPQLDDASRGFSFIRDGLLDMRMDRSKGISACEWIQSAEESEMADVFYHFGEERFSRRIARAIVAERGKNKIESTLQLAEIVKAANPAWEKNKHPATRVFQAIRIHINNELDDLKKTLEFLPAILKKGGRLVVISFQSLEDRLVKNFINEKARGDDFPPDLPVTQDMLNPVLKKIGKAVKSDQTELEGNIRARSAVMRVAEKITD